MRAIFLEQQDIIKITGQRFYKRGYDYFKKGRIHGLNYNPMIDSWSAQVRGAQNYQVRVFFFENEELEAKCNCPAYETHYTCKHIAAVLLSITQQSQRHDKQDRYKTKQAEKQTASMSDPFPLRMIEAFETIHTPQNQSTNFLQVDYMLSLKKGISSNQSLLTVELKVGEHQLYIIKDIRNFLIAVQNEQLFDVTKKFTYDPRKHVFSEDDQQLLNNLFEAQQQESIYASDYYEHDKRSLCLPAYLVDSFLNTIGNLPHSLTTETGEVLTEIKRHDQIPKLVFPVEMESEQTFLIDFSDLFLYRYLTNYGYLLKENNFYKLSTEQRTIIDQLYRLLPYRNKQSHRITNETMGTFTSHVIPILEKIGKIHYTMEAERKILSFPLETKIYFEEKKNALSANITFDYGPYQFLAFQKKSNNDAVIKRDAIKETRIINLLEQAGFHYLNQHFQLFNHAQIYQFLHEGLEELENHATIFLSDQVENLLSDNEPILETNIGVNKTTGMLDISFDMEGISGQEVQAVLQALVEKKQYYRVTDGPLLKLDDESFLSFQAFAETFQLKKKDLTNSQIELSAARSFQVEDSFSPEVARYQTTFNHLLTNLTHPQDTTVNVPSTLKATLRDYQTTGFYWLKSLSRYKLGGILADEMGLGKTIQTISFLLSEQEEKGTEHYQAMVIAPASLVYNWKKEIEKFAPSLTTKIIIGTKSEREKQIQADKQVNIFITSYPLIRKDIELYESYEFDALILDEAQAIKNHLTLTARATRLIQAKQRFALSGTPIENGLEELWSIFQTISPGFLSTKRHFLSLNIDYIKRITRPFILRRLKEEVLSELPAKIETEQYAELTKQQKEVYLAYLEKMQTSLAETIDSNEFNKRKLEVLAGLTRLRQICCHPSLFLENYEGQSGKLEHLQSLVTELRANGKRPLIFSQFSSMLKIIHDRLASEGHKLFYLDGSTPSQERVEMADAFNDGEKDIFLISLKAGGTGLNLTGADTVILYDLWWNPAVEAQAAGRAHRIGQKNVVQVIRLITTGTIEEKIYQLQAKKRELVDQVIQPGETMLTSLTKDELQELLAIQ